MFPKLPSFWKPKQASSGLFFAKTKILLFNRLLEELEGIVVLGLFWGQTETSQILA